MPTYCLDASILVLYISEERSDNRLKKMMKGIEFGKSRGILSVINLAEFHRAMTRIFSEDDADIYVTWLKESKIKIISPTIELACLASVKKQKYASARTSFAWGDAYCLATALEHDADKIITSDRDFEKVSEISVLFL
jgi:predicted nucleic acid-binding protein